MAVLYTVDTDGIVRDVNEVKVFQGTVKEAIDKAIAITPAGASVGLLEGDFVYPSYLNTNRKIDGLGSDKTTLIASGTGFAPSFITIKGSGIGLEGMEIRSTKYKTSEKYGGVLVMGFDNNVFKDLHIHDFPRSHGIEFRGSSYNDVFDSKIHDIGSTIKGQYGNGVCGGDIYPAKSSSSRSSTYNYLKNVEMWNCSMVGINWEPGDNNLAEDCIYYESDDWLPYWVTDAGKKIPSRAVTIWTFGDGTRNGDPAGKGKFRSSGNKFKGCRFYKKGIVGAIQGDATEFVGCILETTENNPIESNHLVIQFNGDTSYETKSSRNIKITNCDVRYLDGCGIKLYKCDGATVKDNRITGNGTHVCRSGDTNSIVENNGPDVDPDPSPKEYIITKEGEGYVAKDSNGVVLGLGSNAGLIINEALGHLRPGRKEKEKVIIKTSLTLSERIDMPDLAVLQCDAGVVITGEGNNQLVGSNGTHDWDIIGGEWVCTWPEGKSSASPMVFIKPKNCRVLNAKVRDSLWNNIIVQEAEGMVFKGVESYHSWAVDPYNINGTGWSGIIFTTSAKDCLVEDCYLHDCGHGGCYFYTNEESLPGMLSGNVMRNNRVERCGTSGLSISQRSPNAGADNNIIEGNILVDCGLDTQHPFINVGWKECFPVNGTIVRYNTIIDNGVVGPSGKGADQGIINQGSNTQIYGNDIKGSRAGIVLLCGSNLKVYNNNIHDAPEGLAMLINTPVKNSLIEKNRWSNVKKGIEGEGSGNTIRFNGQPTRGINDPSLFMNLIRGGSVRWDNQLYGATGEANSGKQTTLVPPDNDEWKYLCIILSNLEKEGVIDLRTGGHDPQALQLFLRTDVSVIIEKARLLAQAASRYNIKVTLTLGGFADPNTSAEVLDMFDPNSQMYKDFERKASQVADGLQGLPALKLLELLNEPDHYSCMGHWLSKYPAGGMDLLNGFAVWQDTLISGVKSKQMRPGVKLGMGTAIDGTLYCNAQGQPVMDWLAQIENPNVLVKAMQGMELPSCHLYLNEDNAAHRAVFTQQKVKAFASASKVLGKPLLIGETGGLWAGGVYDAEIEESLLDEGFNLAFMVRWFDPKKYVVPEVFPERPKPPSEPVNEDLVIPLDKIKYRFKVGGATVLFVKGLD